MEKLRRGVREFRSGDFQRHRALFERLSSGQSPRALFITCSDSRVDPNLITGSAPGELFVLRNVGALAPPYTEAGARTSAGSAVEYAIGVLGVAEIILCGHSGCGALKALYEADELGGLDDLGRWVDMAMPAKEQSLKEKPALRAAERALDTEQNHVICQLANLRTYPVVQAALKDGRVRLHGWHYDIASGVVTEYDAEGGGFAALHEERH